MFKIMSTVTKIVSDVLWQPFLNIECFVPSLVDIGPEVLEKKIFKFHQCIVFVILLLYPIGKGCGTSLHKLDFPFPKDALCQV